MGWNLIIDILVIVLAILSICAILIYMNIRIILILEMPQSMIEFHSSIFFCFYFYYSFYHKGDIIYRSLSLHLEIWDFLTLVNLISPIFMPIFVYHNFLMACSSPFIYEPLCSSISRFMILFHVVR